MKKASAISTAKNVELLGIYSVPRRVIYSRFTVSYFKLLLTLYILASATYYVLHTHLILLTDKSVVYVGLELQCTNMLKKQTHYISLKFVKVNRCTIY